MSEARAPLGATTHELITIVQESGATAPDALDKLFGSHEMLIRAATVRVAGAEADYDAFLQEARLAFLNAVRAWAPDRGASFSTYSYGRMTRSVARAVRRSRRTREQLLPLAWGPVTSGGGAPEPADPELPVSERIAVRDAVRRLPLRDRALLFGLYWRDQTQQGVARSLGVTQQFVSKRHIELLAGLKTALTT
jgi:RNA polymerase sigma factor (sigma-70 family)